MPLGISNNQAEMQKKIHPTLITDSCTICCWIHFPMVQRVNRVIMKQITQKIGKKVHNNQMISKGYTDTLWQFPEFEVLNCKF